MHVVVVHVIIIVRQRIKKTDVNFARLTLVNTGILVMSRHKQVMVEKRKMVVVVLFVFRSSFLCSLHAF
jgi:hypothetical protein